LASDSWLQSLKHIDNNHLSKTSCQVDKNKPEEEHPVKVKHSNKENRILDYLADTQVKCIKKRFFFVFQS